MGLFKQRQICRPGHSRWRPENFAFVLDDKFPNLCSIFSIILHANSL